MMLNGEGKSQSPASELTKQEHKSMISDCMQMSRNLLMNNFLS